MKLFRICLWGMSKSSTVSTGVMDSKFVNHIHGWIILLVPPRLREEGLVPLSEHCGCTIPLL